nr:hypothetical protein [Tanacetum cinerariifolium]
MGYEHFNTNLVTKDIAESSTKNLIPIPNECLIVSKNGSQSTEPINDNSSDFTIISNLLFDNDKINSDEINSQVESNYDESTSNHDAVKSDYLDEFYGPFIPIHILEEERIRREHTDYINRMEMLFIINPHNPTNNNTNVESFSSFSVPNQESEPRQEEIDVDCIDARVKFDVFNDKNDVFMFVIFAKEFSLLFAESEDMIFDPETNLFLASDNSIPPGIENVADDDIRFLEELLIDDSILSHESPDSNFEDNPSIPRSPPEPPDDETDAGEEIPVVMNDKDEDVDYSSFNFVIYPEMFPLLLRRE